MANDIYYCGLRKGKSGLLPASNYDNRFSGGREDGKSHFILSEEKHKNINVVDCVLKDLIVDDPFILGIIRSDAGKIEKINGVFIEFKKEEDKFKAVGIPIINSAGSYLRFVERIYAYDEKALPSMYASLMLATANDATKKSLRDNINRRNHSEIIELSKFVPENILDTLNDNLYLYHSEKQNASLIHILKANDGNSVFENIVLNGFIDKIVKEYTGLMRWGNFEKAEKVKSLFRIAIEKKNHFYQWLVSHIAEIEEKVDNYRAEDIKPPPGLATWENKYQEYQARKFEWEIHEEILHCLIQ